MTRLHTLASPSRSPFGRVLLAALCAFLVGGGLRPLSAQDAVPVLISNAWLAEHLEDDEVVVLYVGMAHGEGAIEAIPGAHFVDYHAVAIENDLSTELPAVADLEQLFRDAGVSASSRIIVYGSPLLAGRAYMTLDYLGAGDRTSMLDGGLTAWKAEGRPLADEFATGMGDFHAQVNRDVLVSADWIAARVDDPGVTVVDARPDAEYTGERTPEGLRPGHIPGAYNLYWEDLIVSRENPVLKSLEEVKARFAESGAEADATLVSYCYIGMRASFNYVVAKHLGFDIRFYDGSWDEWGARADLPVVAGSSRR